MSEIFSQENPFNEDALGREIARLWGEHGAHSQIYDMLRSALAAETDRADNNEAYKNTWIARAEAAEERAKKWCEAWAEVEGELRFEHDHPDGMKAQLASLTKKLKVAQDSYEYTLKTIDLAHAGWDAEAKTLTEKLAVAERALEDSIKDCCFVDPEPCGLCLRTKRTLSLLRSPKEDVK